MDRSTAYIAVVIGLAGCGGGSSGGDAAATADGPLTFNVPIDFDLPMPLPAGTYQVAFPVALPDGFELGTFRSLTLDAQTTFAGATITRVTPGADPVALTVGVTVAAGDAGASGCAGGVVAGQVAIEGDATLSTRTISPAQVVAPTGALALLSSRAFTVCIDITASTDVMLAFSGGFAAGFEIDASCDEPPAALAGTYLGTYTCDDACGGSPSQESGDITIEIRQLGATAVYWDDGGAVYLGSVCGSEFRHIGGKLTYWEFGRFTRDGAGASKTSTWFSPFGGTCSGTCTDALSRQGSSP